ncbi:MAG TPA: hypothetical protein VFR32_10625 [Gaiellaceae bacterium]|nr:hypothetical protein [Gaiellaceae bacterium]
MRRALVLSALFLVALPSIAVGASPNDSATGSGRVTDIFGASSDFSFAAHSGPAGEDAKGNLNFRNTQGYTENNGTAEVTCLLVTGNDAIAIGEWKGNDPAEWPFGPSFPFAVLFVEDNGEPSDATPDRGIAFGVTGGTCADWYAFGNAIAQPLEQGNVVVYDAT